VHTKKPVFMILAGVNGCAVLVSLQMADSEAERVPNERWHSQLTQLCLAKNCSQDAQGEPAAS
jgi:hypothetical protein